MKNLPIYFLILFLISCGGDPDSSSSNQNLEISYEIDTVMVDAGDHFFFVQYNLGMSGVDPVNKLLFNYDYKKHQIEVIDLQNLKFLKTISLQKEGPEAIGSGGYIFKIEVLQDKKLLAYDFKGVSKLDFNGKKIEFNGLRKENLPFLDLNEDEDLDVFSLTSYNGQSFFSLFQKSDLDGEIRGLVYSRLNAQESAVLRDDFLDFSKDLIIKFELPRGGYAIIPEKSFLVNHGDSLIINNSAINKLWIYHPQKGMLLEKAFESQLTSNSKKGNFPKTASSNEEFDAARKEKSKEVEFGPMVFDPSQSKWFRFHQELERVTASDSLVMKTVLTAWDSALNPLNEVILPENFKMGDKPFMLDGMIWQFLNIDDEVAFVRFKPEIK
jgi:hypothetical protein